MALADTARLVASLELKDEFSRTAAKFDRTVAGMDRRTQTFERIGNHIGSGIRNTAQNLGRLAIIGGGVIASQVAIGVRSLAQLEEATAQTEARIESSGGVANVTAEQIRGLSESLENLSTVDDKVIQSGANMLLTFHNIRNEVGEGNDIFTQATEVMLDLSVAMGTDTPQAALQLGKALNDPVRGLTALRRVGVQFTEEQEEQIKTLVKAGRTMDAQKIILRELTKEFGGSAAAFGESGPGATMRRFADAVEDGQQALARGFLPLMERLAGLAQDAFANPQVIAGIERFSQGLAGGLDDLIDVASKLPWGAIGSSLELAGTGAKAVLTAFTSLPPWVQTAVLTGWGLNKLTGGALSGLAGTLFKGLLPGGGLRGSTPATPLFVSDVTGALGGKGGAPVAGGKGGGLGSTIGKFLGPTAGIAILAAGGSGQMSPETQASLLAQKLRTGLSVQEALNTSGATLGAVRDLANNVDAQAGLTQVQIAELQRLANQPGMTGAAVQSASSAANAWSSRQLSAFANLTAQQSSGFARQHALQSESVGVQRGILAKPSSFTAVVNVSTLLSVSDVQRRITSQQIAIGRGPLES